MYLPNSSSLSSSVDSSKTSSSKSAPTKTGDAITCEHEKLSKLDQQNSINKLAKLLNLSGSNREPDYLVLRNSSIKSYCEKFCEIYQPNNCECEAQSTLKNYPPPNFKAFERVRTQSTFKNYPYDPSSYLPSAYAIYF